MEPSARYRFPSEQAPAMTPGQVLLCVGISESARTVAWGYLSIFASDALAGLYCAGIGFANVLRTTVATEPEIPRISAKRQSAFNTHCN
jgi:hypothetical protein